MSQTPSWQRPAARRISRRGALLVGGGTAAALVLAACGGEKGGGSTSTSGGTEEKQAGVQPARVVTQEAASVKRGGTIRIGHSAQPSRLDPHLGSGGTDHRFLYPLFDNLVTYDSKALLNPAESLAEKWEVASPTRYVFSLRPGVKFHDGSDFNAEVAKWNIERSLFMEKTATAKADLIAIDKVEAINSTTVAFTLKQPNAGLLTNLGDRGGLIVSRAAIEKLGNDNFGLAGVGSGPFKFKEWRDQSYLSYERNPTYWRKAADGGVFPYLEGMRFDFIPETTVLAAAVEGTREDLIFAPDDQVDLLEANKNLQASEFFGRAVGLIYFNHALPPLDNADFRRALAWSFDRQTYSKLFFGGRQPPAESYLPPTSWAYHKVPDAPKFDLDKARAFVQQSGIPPEKRTFDLNGGGGGALYGGPQAVALFQKTWEQIGIKVNAINGPQTNGRSTKQGGGDGTLAAVSGLSLRADPDAFLSLLFTDVGTYNWGLAPCPGAQERIEKARTLTSVEERKKLYFEVDEIAAREVFSGVMTLVTSNRVYGVKQVRGLDRLWGGEGKERYANLWLA